jgi:hypothetical protein
MQPTASRRYTGDAGWIFKIFAGQFAFAGARPFF